MEQFREEKYYALTHKEFDALIAKYYPTKEKAYSFVVDMEMKNNTDRTFEGVKQEPLSEFDQEELKSFKETEGRYYSFLANILLTDLCNREIIPSGNYLIEVDW